MMLIHKPITHTVSLHYTKLTYFVGPPIDSSYLWKQ